MRSTATPTDGQNDVISTLGDFSLFTVASIQELRGGGNLPVQAQGENVTLSLPLQKSTTLGGWETFESIGTTFPKTEDK
jgi:hypothetical protein